MINAFRAVSFLEGLSYLLILSVSLGFISREFVFYLGMTHGVLFLLYLVFSLTVAQEQQWSVVIWLAMFLASIVPFAFVLAELFLKKAQDTISESGAESESEPELS
ncbi:DUF3817 domain-containing protein [Litoribrevibacter albus]|uniref:Membrane protein n=1 Tax=Litoribrevibacter albus TaxID=1473156 RepID=A0AA37S831_9GAMM|nr:DUF3817 domain-containing protein [Litoribrevibacter albus]GLQ30188.1 membrane protein [Litoribrevibacter albus]